MVTRTAATLLALLALSCGSKDPVSYSAPVGISLDARSGDVAGGVIRVDKNVSTETGNPYGAFVNSAVQKLGQDPSRITVTSATLTLEPTSSQVTDLQQVFQSSVQLSFQPNGTDTLYPVASAAQVSGTGPVSLRVIFDSAAMTPADFDALVGGSFKVVLEGNAAGGFAGLGATANLEATMTFVAYP